MTDLMYYICADCQAPFMRLSKPDQACISPGLVLLKPNSSEASAKHHMPIYRAESSTQVVVEVGQEPHPMLPEHYIPWLFVQTSRGGILHNLDPGNPPQVVFKLAPAEVLNVFAYCNRHGLWQAAHKDYTFHETVCSAEFAAGCQDS